MNSGYPDFSRAVPLTRENVGDFIVTMAKVLDEANIPATGRWIILPKPKYPKPRSKKARIQNKWLKHGQFGKPRKGRR